MVSERSFEINRIFIQWGYAAKLYPFILKFPSFEMVTDDKKWKWIQRRLFVTTGWSYFSAGYILVNGILNYVDMSSLMISVVLAFTTCLGADVQGGTK